MSFLVVWGWPIVCLLLCVGLLVLGLAFFDLRQRYRQQLLLQQHLLALFDSLPDIAWLKGTDSRFLRVNPAFAALFKRTPQELIGQTDFDISPSHLAELYVVADRRVMQEGITTFNEEVCQNEDGTVESWADTLRVPVCNDAGQVIGCAGMARDSSERKHAEVRLSHMSHHDYLTNLANRPTLEAGFSAIMQHAELFGQNIAMFFIDLDNFKDLNDMRGHSVGDGLLKLIAERLDGFVGPHDALGRFGGDEFVVVLGEQENRMTAMRSAQQLRRLFDVPFTLDDVDYQVGCCIGMSLFPEDGTDYDTLVRHADMAMCHAKNHGKNRLVEFKDWMGEETLRRISIEQQLKQAIARGEFSLHYQPKMATDIHEMVGMEVLLRWHNPVLGWVPPTEFIPVAEQSRLILEIGDWVLEQAMMQNLEWQRQGLPLLPLAVNMSAVQVHQHDFVPKLIDLMSRLNYPGSGLELELTESVVMEGPVPVNRCFEQLRRLGVKISIDDFGTGYSNLGYLSRFPLDTLKIDRSFVTELQHKKDNQQIVQAIVQLARSLELSLVAEGVETADELAFITQMGIEVVQGYYFSRPLPPSQLQSYMEQVPVPA